MNIYRNLCLTKKKKKTYSYTEQETQSMFQLYFADGLLPKSIPMYTFNMYV